MTVDVRPRPVLRPPARLALEFLLVVAALAVLAFGLVRLRLVVLPVILAIFVSTLLVPIAGALHRRRVPRALATLLAMFGSVALLAGLVALLAPTVAGELDDLGREAQAGLDQVLRFLAERPFGIGRQEVEQGIDRVIERVRENSAALSRRLVSGAVLVGELIAGFLLTIVLVFFFVNDGRRIWGWVVSLFSARRQGDVDELGHRAWRTVGGYLRGVAVVALVDAVLIGLVLLIVGVPLVLPLALLTFFGAFFPLVGAAVAGVVAALVALVTTGVAAAVIVVVAILVIQEIEGDVLYPFVVGRAIRLHGVAILLLLTAGSVVAGVVGALFAVPLGAVVWEAVKYLRRERPPAAEEQPA
ncbi:MAG: AI-2E family transporter [Actinomycetota bacterium]|nr:AI-2E family transporter [Actinomycetota bacterium]